MPLGRTPSSRLRRGMRDTGAGAARRRRSAWRFAASCAMAPMGLWLEGWDATLLVAGSSVFPLLGGARAHATRCGLVQERAPTSSEWAPGATEPRCRVGSQQLSCLRHQRACLWDAAPRGRPVRRICAPSAGTAEVIVADLRKSPAVLLRKRASRSIGRPPGARSRAWTRRSQRRGIWPPTAREGQTKASRSRLVAPLADPWIRLRLRLSPNGVHVYRRSPRLQRRCRTYSLSLARALRCRRSP